MGQSVLFGCVVAWMCVASLANAFDQLGNPWTTKADVKLNSNVMVQGEEPDVAPSDDQTDQQVVEGRFVNMAVNLENLKTFIKQRGVSDMGLIGDLISRAACIIRLETDMGVNLNVDSVNEYLRLRERALGSASNIDDSLEKACDYRQREIAVRKYMTQKYGKNSKSIGDLSKDDLKLELTSLGFLSTSGSKAELIYRLGDAKLNLDLINAHIDDFDTSQLKSQLQLNHLSTDGTTSTLLTRLASYLVDVSASTGPSGVNAKCDMVLGNSVCIAGGAKVLAPMASPRGMVGHWTFDDSLFLDMSGLGNHAKQPGAFGPGLHGVGTSAYFDGSSYVEIPHSADFSSQDFCVTYWLYLIGDSTGEWRPIIHKGSRDQERTPTFFLEPQNRGLEFFVSTTDTNQPAGERLWSNTFIPLRRWTHVAGCAEGRNLRLFINGILDAENTTIGVPLLNEGTMYVGGDIWRSNGGVQAYLDEMRYFTRSLTADEIQAAAYGGLGGVEPSFVELGCMGCTLDACPKSCRRGYRMCTARDMSGGAYVVGRSMGWCNSETRVWTAEDTREAADTPDAAGLCMCCREEDS
jgi:hypothetical protein